MAHCFPSAVPSQQTFRSARRLAARKQQESTILHLRLELAGARKELSEWRQWWKECSDIYANNAEEFLERAPDKYIADEFLERAPDKFIAEEILERASAISVDIFKGLESPSKMLVEQEGPASTSKKWFEHGESSPTGWPDLSEDEQAEFESGLHLWVEGTEGSTQQRLKIASWRFFASKLRQA